jgi:molybdopterin converting factor small subunit
MMMDDDILNSGVTSPNRCSSPDQDTNSADEDNNNQSIYSPPLSPTANHQQGEMILAINLTPFNNNNNFSTNPRAAASDSSSLTKPVVQKALSLLPGVSSAKGLSSLKLKGSAADDSLTSNVAVEKKMKQNNYLIHSLRNKVHKAEETIETQGKSLAQLEDEVKSLKFQLNSEKKQKNELNSSNNKLSVELAEAAALRDKLQLEIKSFKEEIVNKHIISSDEMNSKDSAIQQFRLQVNAKNNEINELMGKIADQKATIADLHSAVRKEQHQILLNQTKVQQYDNLHAEFQQYIEDSTQKFNLKCIELEHCQQQLTANLAWRQKCEDYLTTWEAERNRSRRRLNRAVQSVETLKLELSGYKSLLKYVTTASFVKQWRLRKILRKLYEKIVNLSTTALIEQTEIVPSLGVSVQLAQSSDLALRAAKLLHNPALENKKNALISYAKLIDQEMNGLLSCSGVISAQKARWAETAQSFFQRNVEITNECNLANFSLLQAQSKANSLRKQAELLVNKYETLENKLYSTNEALEASRNELEHLKRKENNEIREKKLEISVLFERSVELRRRCVATEQENAELTRKKGKLEGKIVELHEIAKELGQHVAENKKMEQKLLKFQAELVRGMNNPAAMAQNLAWINTKQLGDEAVHENSSSAKLPLLLAGNSDEKTQEISNANGSNSSNGNAAYTVEYIPQSQLSRINTADSQRRRLLTPSPSSRAARLAAGLSSIQYNSNFHGNNYGARVQTAPSSARRHPRSQPKRGKHSNNRNNHEQGISPPSIIQQGNSPETEEFSRYLNEKAAVNEMNKELLKQALLQDEQQKNKKSRSRISSAKSRNAESQVTSDSEAAAENSIDDLCAEDYD